MSVHRGMVMGWQKPCSGTDMPRSPYCALAPSIPKASRKSADAPRAAILSFCGLSPHSQLARQRSSSPPTPFVDLSCQNRCPQTFRKVQRRPGRCAPDRERIKRLKKTTQASEANKESRCVVSEFL
ncbi:hypothetical protein QQF64_009138 [Cirrhinus molitorella]|uniref:Uncharacterized protein n=1 Tax=Cirrhinus molitorella TaxID=172907 RepID=A0ABR3M0B7_9TELE